ncbi:hypothetical protein WJX77_006081 [Trebouxia sp. C0004]
MMSIRKRLHSRDGMTSPQAPELSQLSSDSDASESKDSLDEEHSSIPQAAMAVRSRLTAASSAPQVAGSPSQAAGPCTHAAAKAVEPPVPLLGVDADPSFSTVAHGQARPAAVVPARRVQTRNRALLAEQRATDDDDEFACIGTIVAPKTCWQRSNLPAKIHSDHS